MRKADKPSFKRTVSRTCELALALIMLWPAAALSARGDCGQPVTSGPTPTASDCLYILKTAVGTETCAPVCICDTGGNREVTSSDALACLKKAVGQSVTLSCACDDDVADIRGVYTGNGSTTWSNCVIPDYDGMYGLSGSLEIAEQDGASFSASGSFDSVVLGSEAVDEITLDGEVNAEGEIGGSFENLFYLDGELDSVGEGTFSGTAVDGTLDVDFAGEDTLGDSCDFVGHVTLSRD